jgi:hypothetical protein
LFSQFSPRLGLPLVGERIAMAAAEAHHNSQVITVTLAIQDEAVPHNSPRRMPPEPVAQIVRVIQMLMGQPESVKAAANRIRL